MLPSGVSVPVSLKEKYPHIFPACFAAPDASELKRHYPDFTEIFQQEIAPCQSSKLVKKFFCIKQSMTCLNWIQLRIYGLFAKDGRDNWIVRQRIRWGAPSFKCGLMNMKSKIYVKTVGTLPKCITKVQ